MKVFSKILSIIFIAIIIITFAINPPKSLANSKINVSDELAKCINQNDLHFPLLVKKIYKQNQQNSLWMDEDSVFSFLWEAENLIETSPQYGLNQPDFHCDQLTAGYINDVLKAKLTPQKARIDILLTDAMLTLIAHLHYGKNNPEKPFFTLDSIVYNNFKLDSVLLNAINDDFTKTILNTQPKFKQYIDLQDYMKLLKGQYIGDCYEIEDETLKRIANNLERWRWLEVNNQSYIIVNIPSYQLWYVSDQNTEIFKVIVGKPTTPTPTLSSEIKFFTTMPDWVVPAGIIKKEIIPNAMKDTTYLDLNKFSIYKAGKLLPATLKTVLEVKKNPLAYVIKQSAGCDNALGSIVFNFKNNHAVYLHDTPQKHLFNKSMRALSHGCIRLQHPERLADLLLKNDASENNIANINKAIILNKKEQFYLSKPVSIIITYFTCEIKNGLLITYNDVYRKDKNLTYTY